MPRSLGLSLLTLALVPSAAAAQRQYTWNGPYSGTTNWSAASWVGGVPPAGGGADVQLAFGNPFGTSNYTATNDLGNPFQANRLTFTTAGGAVTVNSTLSSGIALVGPGAQVVLDGFGPVTLNGVNFTTAATVTGSGRSDLSLVQPTISAGLTIDYPQPVPFVGAVRISGPVSGSGGVTINAGNVQFASSSITLTGPITVNGGTVGGVGTVFNPVALNTDLVYAGDPTGGPLALNGVVRGNWGVRVADATGTGAPLALQAANTYTGPTVVDVPPVGLGPAFAGVTFSRGGSALNSPAFVITAGQLALDNATGGDGQNNNNRISPTAPITLNSSKFVLTGGRNATTSQAVGPITGGGYSVIAVDASAVGNGGTTLTAAGLSRGPNRATFLFQANSAAFGGTPGPGAANLVFTSPPTADLVGGGGGAGTTTISILPYAVATPALGAGNTQAGLVTYAAGTGVRLLADNEYAPTINPGTDTNDNVRLTANVAVNADTKLNALVLSNAVPGAGTAVLTLKSGVLVDALTPLIDPTTISPNITLDFNGREAQVFVTSNPFGMTLPSRLTNLRGLTKSGAADLTLTNTANALNGPLTINAGLVAFSNPSALGGPTQIVIGSTSRPGTLMNPAPLALAGLHYTALINNPATITAPVVLSSGLAVITVDQPAASGPQVTLAGVVSGPGGLSIGAGSAGAGVALTNPNNTFSGPIEVLTNAVLFVGGDAPLGNTSQLTLGGGTIRLTGDWTTARLVTFSSGLGGAFDTGGFNATLTSPLAIINYGGFTKLGTGRLTLTQAAYVRPSPGVPNLPPVTVAAGELRVSNPTGSAVGNGPVTVNAGGTLSGSGGVAGTVAVSTGGTLAPGDGAVGQLRLSNDLTFSNGSTLSARVAGSAVTDTGPAGASRVAAAGAFGRSATTDKVTITLVNDGTFVFDPAQTYTRRVATYGSLTNLTPHPAPTPYVASDNVFALSTVGFAAPAWWGVVVDNGSVDVMFGAAPVPEPAAVLGPAALGLAALGLARRARRYVGCSRPTVA